MPKKKVYFPALDSLRAIAMLLVFLAHVGPVMKLGGLDIGWMEWSRLGSTGMILFFILSGFLITYLLLVEQQDRHAINIPNFYMRRILRIWPLYYLIIGICQFLIPYTGLGGLGEIYNSSAGNFARTALCYLFFLPNIAFLVIRPGNPFLGHTWSIGAEEQFYLVWPWILQRCRRYLPAVLCLFIGLAVLSSWAYAFWFPGQASVGYKRAILSKINAGYYWSNIGYFALGALMAFYKLQSHRMVKALTKKAVQITAIFLSCVILLTGYNWWGEFVLAGLFSILILQATQPGSIMSGLHNPLLIFFGKISYGMYVFHVLATLTIATLLRKVGAPPVSNLAFSLLAPFLAFGLSALAGTLSYKGIERFFLSMKKRYESDTSRSADAQAD
jgi:peptidoglycan/LPS O-acetylase OafA/YrhL